MCQKRHAWIYAQFVERGQTRERKDGPKTWNFAHPPMSQGLVFSPLNAMGTEGWLLGTGEGIHDGDYVILENDPPPGLKRPGEVQVIPTTRYRVESIEYNSGVRSMFRARIKFFPRAGRMPSRDY
jgi:hypothetical protein